MDLPLCGANHSFVSHVQLYARTATAYSLRAFTSPPNEEEQRAEEYAAN
jgi:hypothetical protein